MIVTKVRKAFQFLVAMASCLAIVSVHGAGHSGTKEPEGTKNVFSVCVADKQGMPVIGLSENDFEVLIDKQPVNVDTFSERDGPESIVFLVDTSSSMQHQDVWAPSVNALSRVAALSNPGSEYLLVTFSDSPKVVADWTRNGDSLRNSIAGVAKQKRSGATDFYGALALAIERLAHSPSHRKFVLMITDGTDDKFATSSAKIRELLKESGVTVYCIAVSDPSLDPLNQSARSVLKELSSESGGAVLFPESPKEPSYLLGLMALQMRHRYWIGFSTESLLKDGKYHKVEVKVKSTAEPKHDKYLVIAPKGFYAGN